MNCPNQASIPCPASCRGPDNPAICRHLSAVAEWQARPAEEQAAYMAMADVAPAPRPFPGLLEMAGNLATAVADHVADLGRTASPGAVEARKATCEACPQLDAPSNRCRACGCGLDLKWSWASSECPEGRWGKEAS